MWASWKTKSPKEEINKKKKKVYEKQAGLLKHKKHLL